MSKTRLRATWVVVLAAALAPAFPAAAQSGPSPQDHTAHHPGEPDKKTGPGPAVPAGGTPAPAKRPERRAPSAPPAPTTQAGTPGGPASGPASMPMPAPGGPPPQGGMGGMDMEQMMEGMGTPPPKQLYPSLMDIPELSPERREEVGRLARERASAGRELLSAATGRLEDAAARGDAAGMRRAAAEVREALARLESGLSAERAIAEGRAPRELALGWFRGEMGLAPIVAAPPPHGLFGLSWFHYVVMAILTSFAAAMVWMYFHKMRRAEALVARLAAAPPPAASPAAPAVIAAKWSGSLRVARVFEETPDVKTFRLVDPERSELLPFTFDPGQFLTVGVTVDGRELKRSYSFSSSPACQGWCEITVKHAPGGRVSGYLHERVREGDLLRVSAPSGRFTFRGKEAPSVVFIAGGVGVTPLMSSIRYLTDQSWPGEIFLVYACARMADVIFRDELEHLRRRHPNLHVTITLDREESPEWAGPRGYVTKELLLGAVPDIAARRVHLCGPPPMMEAVRGVLAGLGVPAEQVKAEAFLSPAPRRAPSEAGATAAGEVAAGAPVCSFARSKASAPLPPERTVLEAAEAVGVEIDNSCREGYCGVCKVKLLSGRVTMAVEDALDNSDRAQNLILACQARSTGDLTVDA